MHNWYNINDNIFKKIVLMKIMFTRLFFVIVTLIIFILLSHCFWLMEIVPINGDPREHAVMCEHFVHWIQLYD